jgi:putative selenate reductase
MTDKFTPTPITELLKMIIRQFDTQGRIFGIPEELFFFPSPNDTFRSRRFGQLLETPIGVAAGPHTQLSQNIVSAWLTGARYIELKTIQTLDELEISKPCIDMSDEGYNCEWSQELRLSQSFDQYLDAWIIIHILKDKLNIGSSKEPGFIFNMSAGYNLEGILKDNVQHFLNKMNDASVELEQKIKTLKFIYPNITRLNIRPQISDNITLSTMHGCPPDEIEQIADYLISTRKLHTIVKLNPTLIGKEELLTIIRNSGFETIVPEEAFEHDLKFPEAIRILNNLSRKALENHVSFGIKLTNTLESLNNKTVFPNHEKMMYASGKVLHPVSVNVARKLKDAFEGPLDISFSGGVDTFNIFEVLSCGLYPATVCTDLLKPGGYGRLAQYIEHIRDFKFAVNQNEENLKQYADKIVSDPKYKKSGIKDQSIKTGRLLDVFDCAFAPCEETCPTNQGIPSYMYYTAKGEFDKAFKVITETNPFPYSTGMICDHTCQNKCTRLNYDNPLLIREVKRFITESGYLNEKDKPAHIEESKRDEQNGIKVSVIGAGPAGLSCAYYLRKAGFEVEIHEMKKQAGGMVSAAIPKFRLTDDSIDIDIEFIQKTGIKINYNQKITKEGFQKLKIENDFIFIAVGAQNAYKLNIPGYESNGVLNPLEFLFEVKNGNLPNIGKTVIIIGGGNTAMDAARTAYRLCGEKGKVDILYRRTIKQMPAEYKEIKATLDEGVELTELTSPVEVISKNGKVTALKCVKMKLGEKDASGRSQPVEIPDSEFEIPCDTIIPAIGQSLNLDFMDTDDLKTEGCSYETKIKNVFIGGDAHRGASTLIKAVADGRKAALEIIHQSGIKTNDLKSNTYEPDSNSSRVAFPVDRLMLLKAKRIFGVERNESAINERLNFNEVVGGLSMEEAMNEAKRCLLCDETCNICTTLCPNLALQYYSIKPVNYNLQMVKDGLIVDEGLFKVKQMSQIIHIADWCNQCGNCDTFCPTSGAPYKVKPHVYLDEASYEKDIEGYYFDREKNTLLSKEDSIEYVLQDDGIKWNYTSGSFTASIHKEDFRIIDYPKNLKGDYNLRKAALMSLIIHACKTHL